MAFGDRSQRLVGEAVDVFQWMNEQIVLSGANVGHPYAVRRFQYQNSSLYEQGVQAMQDLGRLIEMFQNLEQGDR